VTNTQGTTLAYLITTRRPTIDLGEQNHPTATR
jgi:hypothetical protein